MILQVEDKKACIEGLIYGMQYSRKEVIQDI